ncbi:MAG: tetratricopeptide repeat protein, partial [Bacteroidia bacterium]|nr:tetratricopeptide repeat protein [Bacteroidia bacterium]
YETALLLDPDYEPVLLNKAGLYNLLGEKQKARAILQKLLLKKPGDPRILSILAKI